ncbi:MAG TPA: HAD family phosphatase [Candidatus Binataceae bacterium]|nr:HAD family phosphatase [Candidatus Binataceae bacterium]
MPVRAIIFDLDGTIADTEPLHLEAFNTVLRAEGIEIPRDDYFSRLIGCDDRDCFKSVLQEHDRPADGAILAALIERKAEVYQGIIEGREVVFPGAVDFVRSCAERFPLALVTGTLRVEAETILRNAGIRELFADIVAAEDVEHGKPAPDGFAMALGRLGFILRPRPSITAGECLAIEDTAAGVEAARGAGMRVLAICHSGTPERLTKADIVRQSLRETDLDEVLQRLAALA